MSEAEKRDVADEDDTEERKKGYERGLEMIDENLKAFEYLAER